MELNADRKRARVWDVLGETYRTNPAHLVGPDEDAMLRLWQLYEHHGVLPDEGPGSAQLTVMLAAFGIMSAAKHDALEERRKLARAGRRGH